MNEYAPLQGRCHCGAVQMEAAALPTSVTECNCSICTRYAARWAYFTRQTAHIRCEPEAIKAYSWGDHDIAFFHCTTCGCLTHYGSTTETENSRVAINTRMVSPEVLANIPVRQFDGADTWKYLNE